RYSVLVRQYAITSAAFNYFELLKKNTEQIGGIFDVQPSELTGNLHCINNPDEPVIGYVTVGAVTQKRIFIDRSNIPGNWVPDNPYGSCELHTLLYARPIPNTNQSINEVANLVYPGFEMVIEPTGGGYITASSQCADCTLRGTSIKPSFWK
ncbi:MAG TPA: DUF4249 family protein, partial [Mucilaginibacter sp.]